MQSETFQAFICYNFDDYGFIMKTPAIIIKIITNKGLKCLTLHVMSLFIILVSTFELNY